MSVIALLQTALRGVIKGIGGFDHAEWRSFRSERTTSEARGFIDGDLIEQVITFDRVLETYISLS